MICERAGSNCLSYGLFLVILAISDHCVEDCEEFSGAGGDGELCGFTGKLEALVEGFDGGVVAAGDEAREVEGATGIGASAPASW